MTSLKLAGFCAVSIMLAAHNVFACETAIIDGRKITVSGNEDAEERFKRYAEAKAKERETKVEDELRLRTKMDSANLGPLKPYITSRFFHGFDWSRLKQYEYMDTEPLFRLLDDTDWALHWENVVAVIGAIADKKAAENLLEYVQLDELDGKPYRHFMEAKADSVAALGMTIRRGVYPEGIDFLKVHVMPGAWKKTLENLSISEIRERRLHNQTIIVLSSIGTDEAVSALKKAQKALMSNDRQRAGIPPAKDIQKRLDLIDFYIEEAALGPLESRSQER